MYTGHGAPARREHPRRREAAGERQNREIFPPSGWSRRGAGWEPAKKIPSQRKNPSASPRSRQGGKTAVRSAGMGNFWGRASPPARGAHPGDAVLCWECHHPQEPIPGGERRRILPWEMPWAMPCPGTWPGTRPHTPHPRQPGQEIPAVPPAAEPQLRGVFFGGVEALGEPSRSTFGLICKLGKTREKKEQRARWTLPKNPTSFREGGWKSGRRKEWQRRRRKN